MNPVEPRIEVEVLVLEAVLHCIARRELMLVLCADNHVPLCIAPVHTRRLRHLLIIIVDAQLPIGTCKGYAGMECTARLEAIGMGQSHSAVTLARPRIICIPQCFPIRFVRHLVLIVVNQACKPQREGSCLCGGHIQFETQVLIVERFFFHIDGVQFLGDFKETVAIVYKV